MRCVELSVMFRNGGAAKTEVDETYFHNFGVDLEDSVKSLRDNLIDIMRRSRCSKDASNGSEYRAIVEFGSMVFDCRDISAFIFDISGEKDVTETSEALPDSGVRNEGRSVKRFNGPCTTCKHHDDGYCTIPSTKDFADCISNNAMHYDGMEVSDD